jgi:hypothetical protein
VSPRLSSDTQAVADLDNWPDAQHWPSISPTWKVTIAQSGPPLTLDAREIGAGSYEVDTWDALFPAKMPTTPYVPVDRSAAPIVSYPVATVRDAVRDLHVDVLRNARTDFPTLEALEESPVFAALKEAVSPDLDLITADPTPDADLSMGDAFNMAEMTFGARPGSAIDPPRVTSLTPPSGPSYGGTVVTIRGTGFREVSDVTFGSLSATSVDVVSPTQITCVTPDYGTGAAVPVSVHTEKGANDQSPASTFTYVAPPKPTVASLEPNTTSGGRVLDLRVRGTGFLGPVSVQLVTRAELVGEPATNIRVISDTELLCDTPAYASTGYRIGKSVRVVTQGGTSDLGTGTAITFYANLGDPPR